MGVLNLICMNRPQWKEWTLEEEMQKQRNRLGGNWNNPNRKLWWLGSEYNSRGDEHIHVLGIFETITNTFTDRFGMWENEKNWGKLQSFLIKTCVRVKLLLIRWERTSGRGKIRRPISDMFISHPNRDFWISSWTNESGVQGNVWTLL